jgi:hypothetical protein
MREAAIFIGAHHVGVGAGGEVLGMANPRPSGPEHEVLAAIGKMRAVAGTRTPSRCLCIDALNGLAQARRGTADMTHPNIAREPDRQPDAVRGNFEAMADRLIDDAWHLPPEGDQSWRETDARRIFSSDGKRDINDEPAVRYEEDAPPAEEEKPREPVFQPPRSVGVVLPLALATFIVLLIMAVSAPEVLTARFWATPEARTASQTAVTPARMASIAPVQAMEASRDLRPSLARDERARGVAALATGDGALPKVDHMQTKAEVRKKAKPPIGAVPARFARGHSPYKLAAAEVTAASDTSPPAADTTSSPVAMDWKTEAAKWDRMASIIRARREKQLKPDDPGADGSPDRSANAFP